MKKVWRIPNALPEAFAERVWCFLNAEMPLSWWFRAVAGEEQFTAEGGFGYSFRRTVFNHSPSCGCPVCETSNDFASELLIRKVAFHTGVSVSELGHSFASWYAEGDFLSTHTDVDNGKLAFVWNLTKNWRPQWGGLLHLLGSDWRTVESTITPEFNELVIFDVSDGGRPHFVSQVAPYVTEKRLAFSGWFS